MKKTRRLPVLVTAAFAIIAPAQVCSTVGQEIHHGQPVVVTPNEIHYHSVYRGSARLWSPQMGWHRHDYYIDMPHLQSGRPLFSFPGCFRVPSASVSVIEREFEATRIRQLFEKGREAGAPRPGLPDDWSKSPVDPGSIVNLYSSLRVKRGWVLRAYVLEHWILGGGRVWAFPENAAFPDPNDVREFSKSGCPRPPYAKEPMDVIDGNNCLCSYIYASLLKRQFREFGARWHGQYWNTHTIVGENPVRAVAERRSPWDTTSDGSAGPRLFPGPSLKGWKWMEPEPARWLPRARREGTAVTVTFYTYSPLGREGIYRHTDKYSAGNYRPVSEQVKIAEGPRSMVF